MGLWVISALHSGVSAALLYSPVPTPLSRVPTYRIMARHVDDLDLLEVLVQKVAADSEDITATAVILLHGHGVGHT